MTFVSLKLVHFRGDFGIAFFSALTSFGTLVFPRHTSSLRMTNWSLFSENYFGTISSKMYISPHWQQNKLFRLPTKTKQSTVQPIKLIQTQWYSTLFNVKPIKMLSDPVAEAFGLIHRHPSGENLFRVCLGLFTSLSELPSQRNGNNVM